jgi:hypothetical protein
MKATAAARSRKINELHGSPQRGDAPPFRAEHPRSTNRTSLALPEWAQRTGSSAQSGENAKTTWWSWVKLTFARILRAYADCYNRLRTHLTLEKAPLSAVPSARLDKSWPTRFQVAYITSTLGRLNWKGKPIEQSLSKPLL